MYYDIHLGVDRIHVVNTSHFHFSWMFIFEVNLCLDLIICFNGFWENYFFKLFK